MTESEIQKILDEALQKKAKVSCVLKAGTSRIGDIRSMNPVIFHEIIFAPHSYMNGFYTGIASEMNGYVLGNKQYDATSFESVEVLINSID